MANLFDNTKAQSRSQAQANIETRDGVARFVYTASGNSVAADVLLDGETNILRRVPNASGLQLSVGLKVKVNFSKGSRFDAQIIGGGDANSGSLAAASPTGTAASTAAPPSADLTQHPFLTFTGDEDLPMAETLVNGANIQQRSTPSAGTGDTFTPAYFLLSSVDALLATLPDPGAATLPDGATPMAEGLRVQVKNGASGPDSLYRLDRSGSAPVWRPIGTAGTGGGGFTPAAPVQPTGIGIVGTTYMGASMVTQFGAAQYGQDIAGSVQIYQWQRSMDGGASWQGNDGTSNTFFPGGNSFTTGITSGTVRARVRAENALGVFSDWFAMTTDVAYAAPPPDTSTEVVNARTEPATAPLTAGQTYPTLKARLDGLLTRLATLYNRTITAGVGLTGGGALTGNLTLSLVTATASVLGGVKAGTGLAVAADGTLSVVTKIVIAAKDLVSGSLFSNIAELDFAMPVSNPSTGVAQIVPVYTGATAPVSPPDGTLYLDPSDSGFIFQLSQVEISSAPYNLGDTDEYVRFSGGTRGSLVLSSTYPKRRVLRIKNAGTVPLDVSCVANIKIESGGSTNVVTLMPGTTTTAGGSLTIIFTGSIYEIVA